jgi:hypothetical protein
MRELRDNKISDFPKVIQLVSMKGMWHMVINITEWEQFVLELDTKFCEQTEWENFAWKI